MDVAGLVGGGARCVESSGDDSVNSITLHATQVDMVVEVLGECYQSAPGLLQVEIEKALVAFGVTPKEAYLKACEAYAQRLVDFKKLSTATACS